MAVVLRFDGAEEEGGGCSSGILPEKGAPEGGCVLGLTRQAGAGTATRVSPPPPT
ncbi:hypothetical protein HanIR_Chr01g0006641 [Helianthus annuus]|nr:hypothetical protein HanIR_Chr01g0006641 [Helianthus annuus]